MPKNKKTILIIILALVVYLSVPFFVDLKMERESKSFGSGYNTYTDKYSDEHSLFEKGVCALYFGQIKTGAFFEKDNTKGLDAVGPKTLSCVSIVNMVAIRIKKVLGIVETEKYIYYGLDKD